MSIEVFPANVTSGLVFLCPNDEGYEYDTLVHQLGNNYERRYSKSTSSKFSFECEFKYITSAQKATLKTFFDSMKGKGTSFYFYIPPTIADLTGSSSTDRVLVRFDQDKITFNCIYRGLYDCRLKFVQVAE